MKRIILIIMVYTLTLVIILPATITFFYGNKGKGEMEKSAPTEIYTPASQESAEKPDLEAYVKGVVGAEMPALFEPEALKAQAVAARTYAVRRLKEEDAEENFPKNLGQAYMTKEELQQKWGNKFQEYYQKVSDAVDGTKGEIMEYEGEPILAAFHSTSAGKTENAENVWSEPLPYLKSVDSPQDKMAPDYECEAVFKENEIIQKLQAAYPDLILTEAGFLEQFQIVERTEAGYVKNVQVGNKLLSGREIREALGLRSTDFTVSRKGTDIVFTTKGYGHGAGMSQYGANFMAKDGAAYQEILKHYYQGISIKKLESIE